MKKLLIGSLLLLSSTLFADSNIGVRIGTSVGNNTNINIIR